MWMALWRHLPSTWRSGRRSSAVQIQILSTPMDCLMKTITPLHMTWRWLQGSCSSTRNIVPWWAKPITKFLRPIYRQKPAICMDSTRCWTPIPSIIIRMPSAAKQAIPLRQAIHLWHTPNGTGWRWLPLWWSAMVQSIIPIPLLCSITALQITHPWRLPRSATIPQPYL